MDLLKKRKKVSKTIPETLIGTGSFIGHMVISVFIRYH